MKGGASGGFTIVESLIVLAVTGVLFISLAGIVAGQQAKAQFRTAMTDISTQIQSQINEVSSGFYPSNSDFQCTVSGGVPQLSAGSTKLGENYNCVFMGRAMVFGITPASDPEIYKIHTLVGARQTQTGGEPNIIRDANTRVLAPGSSLNTSAPDRSTTKSLLYGTKVVSMKSKSGPTQRVIGFAVASAPNSQLAMNASGSAQSGTVLPSIIPIPDSAAASGAPSVSSAGSVDLIIRALGLPLGSGGTQADASYGPVEICFASGTTKQSGLVTVGTNGSSTSVDFVIFNSTDCT